MPLLDDEALKAAVHDTIAKQILDGLDVAYRDALLQKALVDVIASYNFTRAVDKVAADKAAATANELLASEEWSARVEQAIRGGFDDFLLQLRAAIPVAMKKAIHGTEGNYGGCGSVLACWPKTVD
jgi:hypothetical protein